MRINAAHVYFQLATTQCVTNTHTHAYIPSGQWIHCDKIKIYHYYRHHQMVLNRNRSDPVCVCERWVRGCRSLNKWLMTDFGFCGVPTMFDQKTVVSGHFAIIIYKHIELTFWTVCGVHHQIFVWKSVWAAERRWGFSLTYGFSAFRFKFDENNF